MLRFPSSAARPRTFPGPVVYGDNGGLVNFAEPATLTTTGADALWQIKAAANYVPAYNKSNAFNRCYCGIYRYEKCWSLHLLERVEGKKNQDRKKSVIRL